MDAVVVYGMLQVGAETQLSVDQLNNLGTEGGRRNDFFSKIWQPNEFFGCFVKKWADDALEEYNKNA